MLSNDPRDRLSKTQEMTLSLLRFGHTNREIGDLLGLKEATIEAALYDAYSKLGVRNRCQAAVFWDRYLCQRKVEE